ncbi:MAG: helix-turn-helix domain-containing protein, partial [Bacteroidales bacterium]|nr:helix-turn-helix domain-containing protein [Bacteroidales bacterium]
SVRYRREKNPPETYINIHQDTVSADGNVYITWSGIDKWERTTKDGLQFSYKLNDEEWSPFTYKTGYTFTSLVSGNHTLQVRSKDKDSNIDTTPAEIRFIVLPPMWKHPWFISLFLFLLTIIVYQWIRIIKRKNRLANLNFELHDANSELEIKNTEIERQKERMLKQKDELYHLKLNFFTNISHEFRTPLTLIKGAVDNVKKSNYNIDITQKNIDVAERNSNILINLVSEILEFRKIETGNLKLKAQKVNLHDFLNEIALSFKELSSSKNISFDVELRDNCDIWLDMDKMTKIIYNLLSNAFKFTQSNGNVKLSAGSKAIPASSTLTNKYNILYNNKPLTEFIEIVIEDSGIGIQQSSLDKIFEDFYQEDNGYQHLGTGIGLALIKHNVLLHKADLHVTSRPGVGTRFTLHLHKGKEFLDKDEIAENEITIDQQLSQYQYSKSIIPEINNKMEIKEEENTKLLIVEDNNDLRCYLKDIFLNSYEVIEASNGLDGLKLANEHIPNLIISDIMMPKMDGNEMSAKIKSDINTCHIPIILLTAKTAPQNELEGLSTGADFYITKPFDKQTLEMQVNNMIRTQQKSVERIRKSNPFEINEVTVSNVDNEFIQSVMDIIKANKETENFGVENLAEELNMSRKNLYRKLKSLTGISPIEFIKNVRLGIATDLLQNTNLSISEIAYQSGFNNTTYLFKVFKEKFNCTPKEYRNRYKI